MLVVGMGDDVRMMGRIVIAEGETGGQIVVMVAIAEPVKLASNEHYSLADFQERIRRKTQPHAEVPSGV